LERRPSAWRRVPLSWGFVVDTTEQTIPPHRRAGFEVAGWDGLRWVLEGVFETGIEATSEARRVLERRAGVKVTEDVFNEDEGIFKSRIVLTEFHDGMVPKSERRPMPEAPAPAPRTRRKRLLAGTDTVLYVAISSLVISILALILAVLR
jgi:hypothetical protein